MLHMSSTELYQAYWFPYQEEQDKRKDRQQFNCSFKGRHNTKVVLEQQGNEGRAPLLNSIIQILNYWIDELLSQHTHKH